MRNNHASLEESAEKYRKTSARVGQQQRVHQQVAHSDACAFFNLLTGAELLDEVESLLPQHRERLFPPTETLSMFLAQALNADRSCQKSVNDTAVYRLAGGLPSCSAHTGTSCRARQRLPTPMVSPLARSTGRLVVDQGARAWHWRKRPVRLVGSTNVRIMRWHHCKRRRARIALRWGRELDSRY